MILILDKEMIEATNRLAPHLWALSLDEPQQISSKLQLQGPVMDTISNWLHQDYLPPQSVKT